MGNNDMSSFIIGEWQSGERETEWGSMTSHVIFNADKTFRLENHFDSNSDPLIIKGKYRLEDSKLYCESLNKGKPIFISKDKNNLILKVNKEAPMILSRKRN